MASTTVSSSSSYVTQSQTGDAGGNNGPSANETSAERPLPPVYDTSRDSHGDREGGSDRHDKAADTHVPPALHGPAAQARGMAPGLDRPGSAAMNAAFVTAARNVSAVANVAKPAAPAAPKQAASTPTDTAMQKLADRYDGGPGIQRNYTADQQNGARLRDSVESALAGYPAEFRKNYGDVTALAPKLAQLDGGTQEKYATRAMEALRAPLAQQRPQIEALQRDVAQDLQKAMKDPAQRLAAIFNPPVGSQTLPESAQKSLDEAYKRATAPGADSASVDKALKDASQIKEKMQADIASGLNSRLADQDKLQTESMQRVKNFIDKAETLDGHRFELRLNTEDPDWNDKARALSAKSYPLAAIAEELVSQDGRSQQERDTTGASSPPTMRTPEEMRRDLLNFQEGLNTPDSDIYKRIHAMEKQATDTLTHNDQPDFQNVGAPATFSAITANLPAPDTDYAKNLAGKYTDLAKDNEDKTMEMTGQKPDGVEKALYAAGRFIADMMPPGISEFANAMADAAFPGHAGFTQDQLKTIDFASMVGGLLLGGIDKVPGLKGRVPSDEFAGEGIPHGVELPEKLPPEPLPTSPSGDSASPGTGLPDPSSPLPSTDLIRKTLNPLKLPPETPPTPGAHAPGGTDGNAYGPGVSTSGTGFDVPPAYARPPNGKLQPDPQAVGVYRDEKGQPYVMVKDQTFPVSFDKDNQTWRIARPDNPSGYRYPVRLKNGNWQVHGDVGLPGGGGGDSVGTGNNMANRDRLNSTLQGSLTVDQPGSYPSTVNVVNRMLKHYGINLSNQSAETIINNVHKVDAGDMAHAGASASEVWTFRRDLADSNLPMKDRAAAALGVVLNGVAGPAYMAEFDLANYHFGKNQSDDLRRAMQMFIQFDLKG
jgi:hypothetical protein